MNTFKQHIRSALEDKTLQNALDANAENRAKARLNAFAALPHPFETYQKQVHDIRTNVIDHLDEYLDTFIKNVQANGINVHFANDAAEARAIILQIAQEKNAKIIAKSKSMVSEEIRLNQALEAAGIHVVETDLGEFIIQLRGEHPSHIITPAVHLKREQVGETFKKYLHIPFTDDVEELTRAARKTLRETFLQADIGISGVNFGVADSGVLCLVTNEGNGYMVTTVPKVHIALMGIERLVPTMQDLAAALKLLPRSATGQVSTVYTHFIRTPRRQGDTDGPEERHLVLVNNGRMDVKNSPLQEALRCIRCGACLNACPVFREIGGHSYIGEHGEFTPYSGPIGSVISSALFSEKTFGHLAQASTLCGACKDSCPVDIDLPGLLLKIRAGGKEKQSDNGSYSPPGLPKTITLGLRMYTLMMQHPKGLYFIQKTAGFLTQLLFPKSRWVPMPAFTGWGYSKDLPKPASRPFRERWQAGLVNRKPSKSVNEQNPSVASTPKDQSGNMQSKPELSTLSPKALRDHFQQEFTKLGGQFIACTRETLEGKVLDFLKARNATRISCWEDDPLLANLILTITTNGIDCRFGKEPDVEIGLTRAVAAVAETGSILITSGNGRPLTTSLFPEAHIAILSSKDIYPVLGKVFESGLTENKSDSVLISGPSRTADIEMTLTIGVHGPREVIVFCIDQE